MPRALQVLRQRDNPEYKYTLGFVGYGPEEVGGESLGLGFGGCRVPGGGGGQEWARQALGACGQATFRHECAAAHTLNPTRA